MKKKRSDLSEANEDKTGIKYIDLRIEEIKAIKPNQRSPEEKRELVTLRQKKHRINQSPSSKKEIQEKDKANKQKKIQEETEEAKKIRQIKHKANMQKESSQH